MQNRFWLTAGGVTLTAAIALGALEHPRHAEQAPTTLRALYGLTPPRSFAAARTALVLIDFQQEFVNGRLPLPAAKGAIQCAATLAAWARRSGVELVLVQNISAKPESPVFARAATTTALVAELTPKAGDLVIEKSTAGSFTRTTLDAELKRRGIDTLVLGGLMTHLAVLTTASEATLLGYHVVVAADATATRALPGAAGELGVDAASLQRAAVDTLADRMADVLRTNEIVALPITR